MDQSVRANFLKNWSLSLILPSCWNVAVIDIRFLLSDPLGQPDAVVFDGAAETLHFDNR